MAHFPTDIPDNECIPANDIIKASTLLEQFALLSSEFISPTLKFIDYPTIWDETTIVNHIPNPSEEYLATKSTSNASD